MNEPTKTERAAMELDAQKKYLAILNDLVAAHKNVIASDHAMAAELSNKILNAHGLCLRQIKRLQKVIAK